MANLQELMQEEYERMRRIKAAAELRMLQNADVEGKLRISTQKKQISYYQRLPQGKSNGEYIPKKNIELAERLAQKTYDAKIIKLTTKRERQLEEILQDFKPDEIELLYQEEHPLRRELITPAEPTWQQVVDQWMKKPIQYPAKPFSEDAPVIYTNRKERVRSKTERTIANYLDRHNIPYKYECPIYLPPFGVIYPDITLLSRKTGEEVYWEHEGMMDNPTYAQTAVKKINLYQENGILIGDRLILTFETTNSVLNEDIIEKIVKQYL